MGGSSVGVQGEATAAARAAAGAAGRRPLPVPKFPWRYAKPGELEPGMLGATDKAGNVLIRRGLSPAKQAEVLRHELGHRVLTPLGDDALTVARQDLSAWFYRNSAIARVLEEGAVQWNATESLTSAVRLAARYKPWRLGRGDLLIGGTIYAEATLFSADE